MITQSSRNFSKEPWVAHDQFRVVDPASDCPFDVGPNILGLAIMFHGYLPHAGEVFLKVDADARATGEE